MGLFSKKTNKTKWNCKTCSQEISINDTGAIALAKQKWTIF
jgi:hypothetical protein